MNNQIVKHTNYVEEKKFEDYVETMKELNLTYDNQFNELTKKWIFITRIQELLPEWKALFRILPFMIVDGWKELVFHIDHYTTPVMYPRNSFSLTSENEISSEQHYFEIERFSTGFKIDLEIFGTPLGAVKYANKMRMVIDSFIYTASLSALKHLVMSPDRFVLEELKIRSITTFQSNMTLNNSYFNCANKANFRDMMNRYAEQIRANANGINVSNKNVIFIVPKEVTIAMGNSVEETFYMTRGDKGDKIVQEGALLNVGLGISILPFTRSANVGVETHFDNQRFFRENLMVGSVAYYNTMQVLESVRDPSEFKKNGFYLEIYNAKNDRMERLSFETLLLNSKRFEKTGELLKEEHKKLMDEYNTDKPYYLKNMNIVDPFIRNNNGTFEVSGYWGNLRNTTQNFAMKFAELFTENYLKQNIGKSDLESIDEMFMKIGMNIKSGRTKGFESLTTSTAEVKYGIKIKGDEFVIDNDPEFDPNAIKIDGVWPVLNGFPMFDFVIGNTKSVKNFAEQRKARASALNLFEILFDFFGTADDKSNKTTAAKKQVLLWSLMQIILFDVNGKDEKVKILDSYRGLKDKTLDTKSNYFGMGESSLIDDNNIKVEAQYDGFDKGKTLGELLGIEMDKIFDQIGESYNRLDLTGVRPLYRLILLFFLRSELTSTMAVKILAKAKCPLPLSLRVLRPHIRMRGFCGVFVIDGGDLGYTLIGTKRILEGDDPSDLSRTIHFAGSMGTAIINRELKAKKSGVLVTDYIGGLGVDFVEKGEFYNPSSGKYRGDMFVQLGDDFSKVLPHSSLIGEITVEPSYFEKSTWYDPTNVTMYYNDYWRWPEYNKGYGRNVFSSNSIESLFNNNVSLENYNANGVVQESSFSALGQHEPGLLMLLSGKGSVHTGFTNYNKNN